MFVSLLFLKEMMSSRLHLKHDVEPLLAVHGLEEDCSCERGCSISLVKCVDFYLTHFQVGDRNL